MLDKTALFTGFMACDYKSTSTIDSINYLNLPDKYTIWVSTDVNEALKKGYDRKLPIMYWSKADIPILVYREVRVNSNKGLFNRDIKENDWFSCKEALKRFYPVITYL
jgi:hypothetical protein